ncbi:MAG: PAS domain S-box protein [Deltaproteobacteria bacterium]|nr:PAS domain S-box protein [Deltaproteobacteria bacterium]
MFEHPEAVLAALLDAVPLPVVVTDARGRILHGNGAASQLFSYSLAEMRDFLHVSDLYHRPDDARGALRAARDGGGAAASQVLLRSRGGELIPARVHVRILGDAGSAGSLGVIEDLREVQDLSRRLEDATRQIVASEKRAAVVALAGQAAHELSQPLMAAMGNVELALMAPGLDPKLAARLDKTYEQLERMRGIVSDFVRMTGTRSAP